MPIEASPKAPLQKCRTWSAFPGGGVSEHKLHRLSWIAVSLGNCQSKSGWASDKLPATASACDLIPVRFIPQKKNREPALTAHNKNLTLPSPMLHPSSSFLWLSRPPKVRRSSTSRCPARTPLGAPPCRWLSDWALGPRTKMRRHGDAPRENPPRQVPYAHSSRGSAQALAAGKTKGHGNPESHGHALDP